MTEIHDRERDLAMKIYEINEIAARFGPIFPMSPAKRPLTPHGLHDATQVTKTIIGWCKRWPDAVPALACGEPSRVVALDVDIRDKVDGRDALEELAGPYHPDAPTAHTPNGGYHILFRWPGKFVKSCPIAPGLDVKGDGGSLMLPPGPGRWWDPHLGPDTALPSMPIWMLKPEREIPKAASRPTHTQPLSRYAEAALADAVNRIVAAPAGAQHTVLNREAFAIGGLVAGGVIPAAEALEALTWAATQMQSFDQRRPWRPREIERQLQDAFVSGQRHPRSVPHG